MNCIQGDRRVLAAGLVGAALALSALGAASAQGARGLLAARGQSSLAPGNRLLRVIDDPSLGLHWLLLRDPARPAGPARLVLAPGDSHGNQLPPAGRAPQGSQAKTGVRALPASLAAQAARLRPVIRAGDRLLLEQDTAIAQVRLAAVAMQPAAAGAAFRARLALGGKVVWAVALGPGRAAFAPEMEKWQ